MIDFMIKIFCKYLFFSLNWNIYSFRKITNDISSATYVISASDNKDKDDVSDLIHHGINYYNP